MAEVVISYDKEEMTLFIEGVGFKGNECISQIDKIVRALDAVTLSRKYKNLAVTVDTQNKLRI